MSEPIFAEGIRFSRPKEGAPTWIKGQIGIKVDEFVEFILKHKGTKEWVNLDLKQSKEGNKLYLQLNTWEGPKMVPTVEDSQRVYEGLDKPEGEIPF